MFSTFTKDRPLSRKSILNPLDPFLTGKSLLVGYNYPMRGLDKNVWDDSLKTSLGKFDGCGQLKDISKFSISIKLVNDIIFHVFDIWLWATWLPFGHFDRRLRI